jgi:hypothetical protein
MNTIRRVLLVLIIGLMTFICALGQEPEFKIMTPQGILASEKFSKYYYCSFDLEKPSTITITSNIPISKTEISPLHDHLPFDLIDGRTLKIKISVPGQILVRINDTIKVFLFAEAPVKTDKDLLVNILTRYNVDHTGNINETGKIQKALDEIAGSGKILFFPPGIYKSGQLYPRSNSTIMLARGAVLTADTASVRSFFPSDNVENRRFIYLNGVENVEIKGPGTISGNGRYLRTRFGDDARIRLILAVKSKNIKIEGLILKDPGSWNTQVIRCNGMILRNLKLLNDVDLSNTDGFDPDASCNVLIEDCFACCGDDNVAVKVTGKNDLATNVDNVTVRGCVFLTKKSALKVGTETRSDYMKNITFEDNDILECDRGMALYVNDGAILDSISYINNRFERNYPDAQKKAIHFEVDRRNPESRLGAIRHVLIKDCRFCTAFPKKSVIQYNGDSTGINVTIRNLVIGENMVQSVESAGIIAKKAVVSFK